jgi:hypothetical protein
MATRATYTAGASHIYSAAPTVGVIVVKLYGVIFITLYFLITAIAAIAAVAAVAALISIIKIL